MSFRPSGMILVMSRNHENSRSQTVGTGQNFIAETTVSSAKNDRRFRCCRGMKHWAFIFGLVGLSPEKSAGRTVARALQPQPGHRLVVMVQTSCHLTNSWWLQAQKNTKPGLQRDVSGNTGEGSISSQSHCNNNNNSNNSSSSRQTVVYVQFIVDLFRFLNPQLLSTFPQMRWQNQNQWTSWDGQQTIPSGNLTVCYWK